MTTAPLQRDEYIEQAHLFRALADRMQQHEATQDLLVAVRDELLATTKLPLAVDFLATELKHQGVLAPAMRKLLHYFTPFQAHLVSEAESERSRFDFRAALEILHREAQYKSQQPSAQGVFLYEFEALCRHRLGYDAGLEAIAGDGVFDAAWREWIQQVRRRIGMVDLADLIYVASEHYLTVQARQGHPPPSPPLVLFGEREGQIALANRHKDPLWLFAALQRHLGYPEVPRPPREDTTRQIVPGLVRRVERLEARLKLVEEEQRGGINLERFYASPDRPDLPAAPSDLPPEARPDALTEPPTEP